MPFDPNTAKPMESSFDPGSAKPFDPGTAKPIEAAQSIDIANDPFDVNKTIFPALSKAALYPVQKLGESLDAAIPGRREGAAGMPQLPATAPSRAVTSGAPEDIDPKKVFAAVEERQAALKAAGIDPKTDPVLKDLLRKQAKAQSQVAQATALYTPMWFVEGGVAPAVKNATSAARKLLNEGVRLTPGQMVGGLLKRTEDAATTLPITGDAITAARRRGIEDFNRAAYNRVLKPIGETVTKDAEVGPRGIAQVEEKISDAYQKLMPKLSLKLDGEFMGDMVELQHTVSELPPDLATQFRNILKNRVLKRLGESGQMDGPTFKQVESELSHKAMTYKSSADAAQRELGRALDDLNGALRDNLERSSPEGVRQELRNVNSAWAGLVRLQYAATHRATGGSVFMPSDLLSAARRADRSVRKGSFARGTAMMQDLAQLGQDVLPSRIANSGTIERGMLAGGTLALSELINRPEIMAGLVAGAAPYTRPGVAMGNAAMQGAPALKGYLRQQLLPAAYGGRTGAPLSAMITSEQPPNDR